MLWRFIIQLKRPKRQFGISTSIARKTKSIVTILYPIIRGIDLDGPMDQLSVYCVEVSEARNFIAGMVFT